MQVGTFIEDLHSHRQEYADTWNGVNATAFESAGHYLWMSSLLGDYRSVLEIGTGAGSGTWELAKGGKTVVTFDENPCCLEHARQRLMRQGVPVRYIAREQVKSTLNGYEITYGPIAGLPAEPGVTMLEGDLLNDGELLRWFQSLPPSDAIVCWLIGSHKSRQLNRSVDLSGVTTPGLYRLKVQNRVYEIAGQLLKPGGVLQIVDRGEEPTSDLLRQDTLSAHREQASVTNLVVESLEYRPYVDPGGLEMMLTKPLSGRMPDTTRLALVSAISRKP